MRHCTWDILLGGVETPRKFSGIIDAEENNLRKTFVPFLQKALPVWRGVPGVAAACDVGRAVLGTSSQLVLSLVSAKKNTD